jgi:ERCC4-type nuclease
MLWKHIIEMDRVRPINHLENINGVLIQLTVYFGLEFYFSKSLDDKSIKVFGIVLKEERNKNDHVMSK